MHTRVALVTGGMHGIGQAVAQRLAEDGLRVFVADRSIPRPLLVGAPGISQLPCDVQCEADVIQVQRSVDDAAGPLDVLVNNAGVGLTKQIPDVAEAEWDAVLGVNLKGAFLMAKHALPRLRGRGGVIVNVSSNAGLLPRAHDPVYCISKAALIALTKSLALCHAADRVRVNAVCPGPVERTGMIDRELAAADDPERITRQLIAAAPLARAWGRMIRPEEVAAAVSYLVSDAAQMVTGAVLAIDGAKSVGVPPPWKIEESA